MLTTPTRIEGSARHPAWCRPLLAGPHASALATMLAPFRSLLATSVDFCALTSRTHRPGERVSRYAPTVRWVIHSGASAHLGTSRGARSWARRERCAPLWITLRHSPTPGELSE